jgi:glycosyltransferase involved in cell wall biosynthesis
VMAATASNARPAALFVAPIMPSDCGNGLAMRTGFLLDAYARRFTIDLAVVPLAGGANELTPFAAARARRAAILPVGVPDTQFALISSMSDPEARLAEFRRYARPSITARMSAELERALQDFVDGTPYDLVHVSRLYLAGLASAWKQEKGRTTRLVLDCDEDDASAYRRFAGLYRKRGHDRRADFAEAEADAFKAFAVQSLPRFDLLLAASASEARFLSAHVGNVAITVIPNVIPASAARSASHSLGRCRRDVLFIGNMSYAPNIDAATWFALRIWPKLQPAVPFPTRFIIVGAGAPREVINLGRRPSIVVAGALADLAPLYRRVALAVVPIRAGGGTRIKLLEGARYGVPMVATRFGAEGTSFRSGQELLLADNELDFAAACVRLLTDGRLASRLAAGALTRVRRDYDAERCAARLLAAIDTRLEMGAT